MNMRDLARCPCRVPGTVVLLVLSMFLRVQPAIGWHGDTHSHLTGEAIKLANIPEFANNAKILLPASVKEDSFPDLVYGTKQSLGLSMLWCHHFWNVDRGSDWSAEAEPDNTSGTKRGFGLYGAKSLYHKGMRYLHGWPDHAGAIALHQQGSKEQAYEYLGRVLHLVQDSCVPAHVHLENHMKGLDVAENGAKTSVQSYAFDGVGAPFDGKDFFSIVNHSGRLANSLPTNHKEGELAGFVDPGGWTPILKTADIVTRDSKSKIIPRPEGVKILLGRSLPIAITHSAGLLRLFWTKTHPGQTLPAPAHGADSSICLSIRAEY